MSLLAYTGPIYRQTKKKFLLKDESEPQVDWMASKAVNFRFIRTLSQYSLGFWSHAKVFCLNFLRGIIWTTHLIIKAFNLSVYGIHVVSTNRVSDANYSSVISVELCPGKAQGVMGRRKLLVTCRVWWEGGNLCSRRAWFEEDWGESVPDACSLRGCVAGVWKERVKLGGGKLNKGARKGFPRAWFSTIFFESPPHKLGCLNVFEPPPW